VPSITAVEGVERTRSPLTAKQIAGVAAGNALEFYDFVTYSFFAVQIGRAVHISPTVRIEGALQVDQSLPIAP